MRGGRTCRPNEVTKERRRVDTDGITGAYLCPEPKVSPASDLMRKKTFFLSNLKFTFMTQFNITTLWHASVEAAATQGEVAALANTTPYNVEESNSNHHAVL